MRISDLCASIIVLFLLTGCAAPPKVAPVARLPIAEAFIAEGSSPSSVSVTSKIESDDCRMMAMPNGREVRISEYLTNTIKLSQLSAGVPRNGPPLVISISEFAIECGKVPAYIELRGVVTRAGAAPREVHVKERFDFSLMGIEVIQSMTQAFDIAVEKFALDALRG